MDAELRAACNDASRHEGCPAVTATATARGSAENRRMRSTSRSGHFWAILTVLVRAASQPLVVRLADSGPKWGRPWPPWSCCRPSTSRPAPSPRASKTYPLPQTPCATPACRHQPFQEGVVTAVVAAADGSSTELWRVRPREDGAKAQEVWRWPMISFPPQTHT